MGLWNISYDDAVMAKAKDGKRHEMPYDGLSKEISKDA